MNIFVAGGTGRVAEDVEKLLQEKGHAVVAGCRHPELLTETETLKPVYMDLHASKEDLKKLLKENDIDTVYFLAGSRGKDLMQTDLFGSVKLQQAAEEAGIKRFIHLSSMFALEPEKWSEEALLAGIPDFNIAKYFADNWLIHNADLDYTIIQPAGLEETPATGKMELNPPHEGVNAIPDVAEVLVDVLEMPNTVKKVIMMRSGDTPIMEALETV